VGGGNTAFTSQEDGGGMESDLSVSLATARASGTRAATQFAMLRQSADQEKDPAVLIGLAQETARITLAPPEPGKGLVIDKLA
jgi:hypothetical protein